MSTHNPEDLLRQALADKADEAYSSLTIDDIRQAARGRQRTPWRLVAVVAAAAALAIGVPTALLLRPDGQAPHPAPSPTVSSSPSPSPSPSPTSTPQTLEDIPRGRAPGITYLQGGTVHLAQGDEVPLPVGTEPVNAFTSYHGGWLVAIGAGGPDRVSWYDGSGTRQSDGAGVAALAVSEDGTRTAYPQSGAIHIGITSGMSDAEQSVPASAHDAWPVGFLRGGALVYQAGAGKVAILGAGTLPGIATARAVSAEDDLVAGEDQDNRTVVVSTNGRVAWSTSAWTVWGFSADGRYAAATNGAPGDAASTIAILDAHSGDVVAQHSVPGDGISAGPYPVMDVDGSLLLAATDGRLRQTVLRLDPDGTLSRATKVFPLDGPSDSSYVIFAARP